MTLNVYGLTIVAALAVALVLAFSIGESFAGSNPPPLANKKTKECNGHYCGSPSKANGGVVVSKPGSKRSVGAASRRK